MTGPSPDIEAAYSVLVVDCKMSFDQIAQLTDAQIYDIIFRERDEKGQVVSRKKHEEVPAGAFDTDALGSLPDTPENQLKGALLLAGMFGADPNKVKAQWEAKHGRSADEMMARMAAGEPADGGEGGE